MLLNLFPTFRTRAPGGSSSSSFSSSANAAAVLPVTSKIIPATTLTAADPDFYLPGETNDILASGIYDTDALSDANTEAASAPASSPNGPIEEVAGPVLDLIFRSANAATDIWLHVYIYCDADNSVAFMPIVHHYYTAGTPRHDGGNVSLFWHHMRLLLPSRFARIQFHRPAAAALAGDPQITEGRVRFLQAPGF